MKKYLFGIDVGGTTVKHGIFTVNGELLHKWEIPTRTENNGEAILPDIVASCKATVAEKGLSLDEFLGLGIGLPGAVDKYGFIAGCVNLGWGPKNVKKELEDALGIEVQVGNDANVAALGELWMGAGKGVSDMVMITLGTGIGGGVIIDDKLVIGAHGFGAEIGHMRINIEDMETRCNCGKYGCWELYCSATGIAREAKKALAACDTPSILRKLDVITAKDVFDSAKASDAFAIQQVEVFGQRMAMALGLISCVSDPDVFVIGGGVSKAGTIITDVIKRYFNDYVYGRQKETRFVIAELGNDAGIYGCAKLVMQ